MFLKNIYIASFFFLILVSGCSFLKETKSSVITGDGNEYQIEYLTEEIELIVSNIHEGKDNYDNVIFFIHGRGRHPEKALNQIIPKLEKEYSAAVIMFHWSPSYAGPIGYPDEHAIEAASALNDSFNALKEYQQNYPKFKKLNPVLLVHSMGNIVFKTYIEEYYDKNDLGLKNIFKNIVLNAPDVKAKEHSIWLNNVKLSNNIFVTTNNSDPVLKFAGFKNHSKRLGKKIEDKIQLSSNPNVKYLNFDKTGVGHRYYLSKGQKNNKGLMKFYEMALNGLDVDLESINSISLINKNNNIIYYFK